MNGLEEAREVLAKAVAEAYAEVQACEAWRRMEAAKALLDKFDLTFETELQVTGAVRKPAAREVPPPSARTATPSESSSPPVQQHHQERRGRPTNPGSMQAAMLAVVLEGEVVDANEVHKRLTAQGKSCQKDYIVSSFSKHPTHWDRVTRGKFRRKGGSDTDSTSKAQVFESGSVKGTEGVLVDPTRMKDNPFTSTE